jgi:hypothetical protein
VFRRPGGRASVAPATWFHDRRELPDVSDLGRSRLGFGIQAHIPMPGQAMSPCGGIAVGQTADWVVPDSTARWSPASI